MFVLRRRVALHILQTRHAHVIHERYAEKLAQKAKERGPTLAKAPPPPPPPPPRPPTAPVKQLSSYLNVEKTAALPAKEIEALWRLRHAKDPLSLSAVIPSNTYSRLAQTARRHPFFILPLPRSEDGSATEIHFLQHAFPTSSTSTTIFTGLAEYKLRGEYATPHTTIVYHTDYAESHGIVLMNGNIMDGRGVSVEQAQYLLVCLQGFYAGVGNPKSLKRRQLLLESFGRGDKDFKVEDVIEEAERLV